MPHLCPEVYRDFKDIHTGGCKVRLSTEELIERVSDAPEYKRYDYTREAFAEELCRLVFYWKKKISGQHHEQRNSRAADRVIKVYPKSILPFYHVPDRADIIKLSGVYITM